MIQKKGCFEKSEVSTWADSGCCVWRYTASGGQTLKAVLSREVPGTTESLRLTVSQDMARGYSQPQKVTSTLHSSLLCQELVMNTTSTVSKLERP